MSPALCTVAFIDFPSWDRPQSGIDEFHSSMEYLLDLTLPYVGICTGCTNAIYDLLDQAAELGDYRVVSMLVGSGEVDPFHLNPTRGTTPLLLAKMALINHRQSPQFPLGSLARQKMEYAYQRCIDLLSPRGCVPFSYY